MLDFKLGWANILNLKMALVEFVKTARDGLDSTKFEQPFI